MPLTISTPQNISATQNTTEEQEWEPWPDRPHPLPSIHLSNKIEDLFLNLKNYKPNSSNLMALNLFFHIPQSSLITNTANQNKDKIAVALNMYMPEAHLGENIWRASSLASSRGELDEETLKFVIFQLSNKFLELEYGFENPHMEVVNLSQSLGLGRRNIMKALFHMATQEPAIEAVLETLFLSAYQTQSIELVSMILEENKQSRSRQNTRIREFPIADALEFAIRMTNRQLAELLLGSLDSVSSISLTGLGGRRLLIACATSPHHHFATKMAKALLSRGANIGVDTMETQTQPDLHIAIASGNQSLVRLLAAHKADFAVTRSDTTNIPSWFHKNPPLIRLLDSQDVLVAAVVACCPFTSCGRLNATSEELFQHVWHSGQRALQMYELVLQKKTTGRLRDPFGCPEETKTCDQVPLDVLIAAAHRGYNSFIARIVRGIEDFYRTNSKVMWPFLAAVMGGNVSTCRLILSIGVDPNWRPPQIGRSCPWLPPLHYATYVGNIDIVKTLFEYKADLNLRHNPERPLRFPNPSFQAWSATPLSLAIENDNYSLFHFFVQSHACINHRDIDKIIQKGNAKMYELLLVLGIIRTAKIRDAVWAPGTERVSCSQHVLGDLENHEEPACRLLELLDNSFNRNLSELSYYLIDVAVSVVPQWLPYALGTLPIASIHSLLERVKDWHDLFKRSTLRGRSCLEMAMISRHHRVPEFVLGVLPKDYDSGALCASLMLAVDTSNFEPLNELLRRRESVPEIYLDPILENTSIALAGYFSLHSVLFSLLRRPFPQYKCVFPDKRHWVDSHCDQENAPRFNGLRYNPLAGKVLQQRWRGWLSADNEYLCSPLWMITRSMDNEVINAMLREGYRCDGETLISVIAVQGANSVPEMLIEGCTDINCLADDEDGFDSIEPLSLAILAGNTAAARILVQRMGDINAYPSFSSYARKYLRTPLQRAVEESGEHAEEIIDIMLDAGADVNVPAYRYGGVTALQIASMAGKLGLARRLIKVGADMNAPRALVDGRTCLEGAAEHGRLDMVQFLLNMGVQTTGTYRVQYIRAILFAMKENHHAVAETLRKHRNWDTEDERLFEKQNELLLDALIHPSEFPLEERVILRRWCWDNRDDLCLKDDLNSDAEADAYSDFSENEEGIEIASTVDEGSDSSDSEEARQAASGQELCPYTRCEHTSCEASSVQSNSAPSTPVADIPPQASQMDFDIAEPWASTQDSAAFIEAWQQEMTRPLF